MDNSLSPSSLGNPEHLNGQCGLGKLLVLVFIVSGRAVSSISFVVDASMHVDNPTAPAPTLSGNDDGLDVSIMKV